MLLRIDHVGIACRNLDEAIARYESVFGLTVTSLETNPEQGVREAMLQVGDAAGGPVSSATPMPAPRSGRRRSTYPNARTPIW